MVKRLCSRCWWCNVDGEVLGAIDGHLCDCLPYVMHQLAGHWSKNSVHH